MLIFDDIYKWEGWGGIMKLGSGRCRLRIFDLRKDSVKGVAHIKPIIVIVSDVPESKMSVKSCSSHIATCVTRDFKIDPHRMLWVEYYPATTYGTENQFLIPEQMESVEFEWHEDRALFPKWKALNQALTDMVKELIASTET